MNNLLSDKGAIEKIEEEDEDVSHFATPMTDNVQRAKKAVDNIQQRGGLDSIEADDGKPVKRGSKDQRSTLDEMGKIMAEDYTTKHIEVLLDSYIGEKYAAVNQDVSKNQTKAENAHDDRLQRKGGLGTQEQRSDQRNGNSRTGMNLDLQSLSHGESLDLSKELNKKELNNSQDMNISTSNHYVPDGQDSNTLSNESSDSKKLPAITERSNVDLLDVESDRFINRQTPEHELYGLSEIYHSVKPQDPKDDPSNSCSYGEGQKAGIEKLIAYRKQDEGDQADEIFQFKKIDKTLDGELETSEIEIPEERTSAKDDEDNNNILNSHNYGEVQKVSRLIILPDTDELKTVEGFESGDEGSRQIM